MWYYIIVPKGERKITYRKECSKMTIREKKIAEVNSYLEKTKAMNYHCKPTAGIDSGRGGKAFEALVKLYLNNYRFKGIASPEGKTDTKKRINGETAKIEIKCNAFEIERLDENGAVTYSIRNNDYIVYAPDFDDRAPVELQAYVIPAELFVDKLYECGCVRLKMTTPMIARKKAGEPFFYDRISIQNNSIKKLNLIYDILDEYGMSLKEFKAMVCGA